MTDTSTPSGKPATKTVAIRLDETVHAQLSIIALLADTTITEEIRAAIEAHIDTRRESDKLATKARGVLDDIERDATTRRDAIETLFNTSSGTRTTPPKPRTRKSNGNKNSASS